jgi:plastocyanin
MRRLLAFLVVAAALFPGSALAGEQILTFTSASISVPAYGVDQDLMLVPGPAVDGYVVGMSAEVVDAAGNVQPNDRVMLHHVVFAKAFVRDATCPALAGERFYAEGEERQTLALPAGYGYPNRGTDRWGLLYMLMNHQPRALSGSIRYTVRYVTGEQLVPVKPYWLDERNCDSSEFDVPGTGGRGSVFRKSWDYTLPEAGSIVAGGGHLHGGGIGLELRDETCKQTLFDSEPTWGGPMPMPILHEPGPSHMSQFSSAQGIALAGGTKLRLVARYDNSKPHTRAMGIMMIYVAPGPPLPECFPPPPLTVDRGTPGPPPPFSMPFPRPPKGKVSTARSTFVGDYRFGNELVRLKRGAAYTWRFAGSVDHNVTVIDGPVGFSSPSERSGTYAHVFTRKGTYRLFCSLHPARMVQRIEIE